METGPTPLGRASARSPEGVEAAASLISETFRLHRELMRAAEALAASCGLTASRWQLLDAVAEREGTVSSLARRLGLTRQSVQRTARELEAQGYLRFTDNPDHRRAGLARLSDKGLAAVQTLAEKRSQWLAAASRGLPTANIRIGVGMLRGLIGRLSESR